MVGRGPRTLFVAVLFALGTSPASSQQTVPAPSLGVGAGLLQVAVPTPEQALILIRSTLLALHQANVTGNYTVFRELAHSSFQALNSAARLGIAFTQLRDSNVDLSVTLLEAPTLTQPIAVAANGKLSLAGQFEVSPRIIFQLEFLAENGRWRYDKISVSTQPLQNVAPPKAPSLEKSPPKKNK